ncbi:hypothetical protein [Prescottella sp. R16]|uniref:hypothetical protein n=1 Tax=Prescottella sp. R16 TaxID=3064529 RepID=UPI00272E5EFF|nr:hypothetical protein [Prescottella sp. R16]
MGDDHNYDVYTIELGPYERLSDLHRELSNYASTTVTELYQTEDKEVVSISHSVVSIDGKLFVSIVLTTDGP